MISLQKWVRGPLAETQVLLRAGPPVIFQSHLQDAHSVSFLTGLKAEYEGSAGVGGLRSLLAFGAPLTCPALERRQEQGPGCLDLCVSLHHVFRTPVFGSVCNPAL